MPTEYLTVSYYAVNMNDGLDRGCKEADMALLRILFLPLPRGGEGHMVVLYDCNVNIDIIQVINAYKSNLTTHIIIRYMVLNT